ncbi:hypothetical protein Ndes2437B_g04174 [Nannochloris sp. 'desiccata']
MSHIGPASSSMGGGAPLGANANNEPALSIRVACEGADCNALLEVPIPDAVRMAAPPSLVIKCAQCKRMLQVNLPSETYSTYDAQLKAQQQAALIRHRQQELATLQALQMQLQAQQTALLSNFPGGMNLSFMGNNFGGGLGCVAGGGGGGAFPGFNQNQMQQLQQQLQQLQQYPQLQQQFSGGTGLQSSVPMSPGTVAALGGMTNLNNMQPTGPYHQTLHQVPSSSSLPQHNNNNNTMLPPAPAQQQQQQQQQYNQQQHYSQQQLYQQQSQGHPGQQQQYQQQQAGHTPALPIMPLSTPAQMPSMPSAAAVLAEHHNHQQQQQQQQQLYQNQMHQQQQYTQQKFSQNASVLPSTGPGSGNMNSAMGGGGGGGGHLHYQGSLQAQQAGDGGGGFTHTAPERPATVGNTAASPTVAGLPTADGNGGEGGSGGGVKRKSKSSPSPGEKEKKPMGEYQAYMKDEYKRLKAENPDMSGKEAFAQAAQAVSHSEEGRAEVQEEGEAHAEENQQDQDQEEEKTQEESKKIEGKEEIEGMKVIDDNDDIARIPLECPLPTAPSAAARASPTPAAANAAAEAEAAAAAAIEAKQSSQTQPPLSPRSMLLLQGSNSLSDVLRMKLAGIAFGRSGDSDKGGEEGQQEVQGLKEEEAAAAAGKKLEEATFADPGQNYQDIQEGFREEGFKNKEERTQDVVIEGTRDEND